MQKMIAAMFLAGMVAATPHSLAAIQASPEAIAPFVAREIDDGVHLLATPLDYRGDVIGNITVIEQQDGMVVIDSGGAAADGRRVVSYIRSITPKPVKALVFTHWHGDHPQGASEIRAAWPRMRVIATPQTRDSLRTAASRYMGFEPDDRFETIRLNQTSGMISQLEAGIRNPATDEETRVRYTRMLAQNRARRPDFRGTYLIMPTEVFSEELILADPVRPVRLLYLGRANTDGDAIAWLPNQRIVVTGDVLVHPIPFGFGSFPGPWLEVLGRIEALGYRVLIPGHGEPQTDSVYLDQVAATLRDLRAQITPLAQQGLSLEDVRERVNWDAQREIFGTTARNRILIDAFWLTPMTVNTYREARGLPMIQGDEEIYSDD